MDGAGLTGSMGEIAVVAKTQVVGVKSDAQTRQDSIWVQIAQEIEASVQNDSAAYSYLRSVLAPATDFRSGLATMLTYQLFRSDQNAQTMVETISRVLQSSAWIHEAAAADLHAFYERDPAIQGYLQAFFFSKGFAALQVHRVGHVLWLSGQCLSALLLQARCSLVYNVDIHPAARLGCGIFLDHATGLVIGETSVVEDNVSILQEVTLGGTGKERGDRHPKIRNGALLCAGAKILGNIEIGEHATVGAGSVVLHSVPSRATVVGVPARVIGFVKPHPS